MMRAALIDIAISHDMTLELARRKAARVYLEAGYSYLATEERDGIEANLAEALASDDQRSKNGRL